MLFDSLIPWAPAGLSTLLIELSQLSLDLQDKILPSCKKDGSLVTAADTSLEDQLIDFFTLHDPNSYVMGEETLDQKGQQYLSDAMIGRSWVLDPIDGTALYALGMEGWGISIGLMEKGILCHGVVAYPKRTIIGNCVEFIFTKGEKVMTSQAGLSVDTSVILGKLELAQQPIAVRPMIAGYPGQISTSQRFAKSGTYAGKHPIICFASSVLTFRLLMSGNLVGYLVKLKLWDLAAVWPMGWRLGIRACLSDGSEVTLETIDKVWRTDPKDPQFLALRDHILFYWPDRIGPEVWQDINLPAN